LLAIEKTVILLLNKITNRTGIGPVSVDTQKFLYQIGSVPKKFAAVHPNRLPCLTVPEIV